MRSHHRFAHFIFIIFICLGLNCQQKLSQIQVEKDFIQHVDPFIGTGFHGHTFPGATLPFGMVQLSPDTRLPGWDASSGYHYSDSTIYGFSHTHLSGTGIGDMGDILFLPYSEEEEIGQVASFQKSKETASPGYYQVHLEDRNILAELTASTRTGMHRYTFEKGAPQGMLIDLGHILQANWGHKSVFGEFEVLDDRTLRGMRKSSGWAHDHPVYFHAEFSKSFTLHRIQDGEKDLETQDKAKGEKLKVWLSFPNIDVQELQVKVGISSVSSDGAKKNLEAENPDWDFKAIKQKAESAWNEALGKIEIRTSSEAIQKNFYTALYHCMLAPMIAQDVDGQYRGMDKKIHKALTGFTNYTVFSMWDTFRALHPLMSIIEKKKTNDWIKAILQKYKEGGVLPKWPLGANYTGTMVGYPSTAIIADALAKGIDDFDINLALEAAVISSEYHPELIELMPEPRAKGLMPKHLDFIEQLGFIPADSVNQSVSYGLECSYYDWCIAQIAQKTGSDEIADKYLNRADYYKAYFDTQIGFMRGKLANGEWREPFNPYYSDHESSEFVEGNSWQWMWFVPHDVEGYIELMGGKEAFADKLDELFSASSKVEGKNVSMDITGLIGQYAHGNEPSHHVAYFYNYLGQAEKTQERVDQIFHTLYMPTPEGISGNEDCGAMSAWYVLNALGIYQVCPGKAEWTIGRPMIDEAIIHLEGGGDFRIVVENNSLENKYIENMELNGSPLDSLFFPHQAIQAGGVLKFWMQSEK